MTTTPNEPLEDPEVVPSSDPVLPGTQPEPSTEPNPHTDPSPEAPPPEPDVPPR